MTLTLQPMELAGLAALLVLFALAGVLGFRHWRRRRAERARLAHVEAIAYDMLRDVLLPDGNDGQIHVDFLLLTGNGVLVLDLRDVPGVIFGGESMDEWAVMDGTRRTTFANPLGLLYDRMAAVGQFAGKDLPVEGRVVFTARGSFPKGRPRYVTPLESLTSEFPAAERDADPSPVAAWADAWARIRAAATPSPVARR